MIRFELIDEPVPPLAVSRMPALAQSALAFHQSLPGYEPTPVHHLDHLASDLGVASIALKDESHRFGLNAFKVLGPSFAIHRWLGQHPGEGAVTFTTATDGNHGRAVAWMARQVGQRAVIFMPAYSVPARVAAIEREGAEVILVPDGYDAAVNLVRTTAAARGWIVIQDTATPGYEEIPEWIAAAYWTMAHELELQLSAPEHGDVDVVLLHAGVGTWPAAMAAYFWHQYAERRARPPRIVVVEPTEADCVIASVRAGRPTHATGSLRTIMAGLNCGFPSTTAYAILARSVDAFITIGDDWAERAMRRLATPAGGDPRVIAGESGAASVAGLMALASDPDLEPVRAHLDLGRTTRVLTWSTEGATDPDNWARVVGRPVPT